MIKNMFQFLLISIVSLFIVGCGLSDTSVESAKNTLITIDKTTKLISEKKDSFIKNELYIKYKKECYASYFWGTYNFNNATGIG